MRVISDLPLRLRWQNKSRDIHYIVRHLTETLGTDNLAESHLQVANELFYRNKAARLVGKLDHAFRHIAIFAADPPDGRRRVIY